MSVSTLKVKKSFIIDDCKKANALNDQFCSVFSTPDNIIPPINTPEVKEALSDIIVPPEGVKALLSQIKPTKAPGPDDIISRFLQEFLNKFTQVLKPMFSTSLDSSELP